MPKRELSRNLLALPSVHEDRAIVNLADWVELNAILSADRNSSKEDLRKALQRVERLPDQRAEEVTNDVFNELVDRVDSCGVGTTGEPLYPFSLDESGTLLNYSGKAKQGGVYRFLLAVSASSMASTARTRKKIDPTKAFERLCADVLAAFWGHPGKGTGTTTFGTAKKSGRKPHAFEDKINELCSNLNEGNGWRKDALAPGGGDGKLDIIAWRKFADKRRGGLVGFAQCKTGVHWHGTITQLIPSAFSATYMQTQLVLEPLRIFMVPERISEHRWEESTRQGGLLLDRCRIVEFAESASPDVRKECQTWLNDLMLEQKQIRRAITK
jgi:hypothetical protein